MSDSDDDFMSDKFLSSCVKDDIRPGLLFNQRDKRKHELSKQQEALHSKKPKSYHEQESEAREKGLNTAISSDNKGFKMLEKMGFKAGSSLGKQSDGLKEPINISLKTSNTGVGLENRCKEIKEKKKVAKENHLKSIEAKFKTNCQEKIQQTILIKDYHKSQRICEELDFRRNISEPVQEYFWTRTTIKSMKNKDEDEEDSDEEPEEISLEKLVDIIQYLRDQYNYCIYCAITGENREDLEANCPGPYREDHDDLN